ncbi:heme-thiolate peroxidase [Neopestalotiopsis clavispora]|nr:heme-thiolate peroxidase [Neopestalotiopsis clavispora]
MKLILVPGAVLYGAFATAAVASGWSPPKPGDDRSPCPLLNSLANHGFIPHDGKNISGDVLSKAITTNLNMDDSVSKAFLAAIRNSITTAETFSLDELNRHNAIEHDASLSRQDFYFGNVQSFNETIFNQSRSYWTDPVTIDIHQAANARNARIETSKATNPTYNGTTVARASGLETAAYILSFGDKATGSVPKAFIEYFFENERLPFQLGWYKSTESISFQDLLDMTSRVSQAGLHDSGVNEL